MVARWPGCRVLRRAGSATRRDWPRTCLLCFRCTCSPHAAVHAGGAHPAGLGSPMTLALRRCRRRTWRPPGPGNGFCGLAILGFRCSSRTPRSFATCVRRRLLLLYLCGGFDAAVSKSRRTRVMTFTSASGGTSSTGWLNRNRPYTSQIRAREGPYGVRSLPRTPSFGVVLIWAWIPYSARPFYRFAVAELAYDLIATRTWRRKSPGGMRIPRAGDDRVADPWRAAYQRIAKRLDRAADRTTTQS